MNEDVYIPSAKAEELTAALWELSDPNPTRGTTGMFPGVKERDGSMCLLVRQDYGIPVHGTAVLGRIGGILQPWIDDELLPAETNQRLSDYIISMRGQRLVVYQAFPALFKLRDAGNPEGLGRTKTEMIEEGRLEGPKMP
jgi:hypothetical protein